VAQPRRGLADIAAEVGLGAFQSADFNYLGERVARDPERLVLVGGQALQVWGAVLGVPCPVDQSVAPLTEDADWLASQSDARWLSSLLRENRVVDLHLAKPHEAGPNTALAYMRGSDGRILLIDFLRAIIGVPNEEVVRLAVPVTLDTNRFQVLHPLLCLQSRFANLERLPAKRAGNGPVQALWAIRIACAFLHKMLREGADQRQVIRACHRIAEVAEYKHGRFCYLTFRLDPLQAVTPEIIDSIGGRFVSDDWPRTCNRIAAKRAQWLDLAGMP
jgi:hypothetical protein